MSFPLNNYTDSSPILKPSDPENEHKSSKTHNYSSNERLMSSNKNRTNKKNIYKQL